MPRLVVHVPSPAAHQAVRPLRPHHHLAQGVGPRLGLRALVLRQLPQARPDPGRHRARGLARGRCSTPGARRLGVPERGRTRRRRRRLARAHGAGPLGCPATRRPRAAPRSRRAARSSTRTTRRARSASVAPADPSVPCAPVRGIRAASSARDTSTGEEPAAYGIRLSALLHRDADAALVRDLGRRCRSRRRRGG